MRLKRTIGVNAFVGPLHTAQVLAFRRLKARQSKIRQEEFDIPMTVGDMPTDEYIGGLHISMPAKRRQQKPNCIVHRKYTENRGASVGRLTPRSHREYSLQSC